MSAWWSSVLAARLDKEIDLDGQETKSIQISSDLFHYPAREIVGCDTRMPYWIMTYLLCSYSQPIEWLAFWLAGSGWLVVTSSYRGRSIVMFLTNHMGEKKVLSQSQYRCTFLHLVTSELCDQALGDQALTEITFSKEVPTCSNKDYPPCTLIINGVVPLHLKKRLSSLYT